MNLSGSPVTLDTKGGKTTILRNGHGIPEISAKRYEDAYYGMGWVHAHDRQLQTLLTRLLLEGRAAETLSGEPALVEIDRYMRRMRFLPDPDSEIKKLDPEVRRHLEFYTMGFNHYLETHGAVFEFRLLGYKPEPWRIRDSLILGKIMAFLGLADAQGAMEKFLVQMARNDLSEKKLRELFPYLSERIDYALLKKLELAPPLVPEALKWLSKIPKMTASNNWAVSGRLTASGKPMYCSDPHLEVNRIPSIWQEIVLRLPDNVVMGASLPGVPGIAIGRTKNLAWGATYSFMDMIDYRIEECRDGRYRRGKQWKPFAVREEVIKVKKGEPVVEKVYENEHGVLEGNPFQEGHYLVMSWSAARACGAGEFNGLLALPHARSAREAMACFRKLEALSFNWVMADSSGNIAYQMSGRLFKRPRGVSGLVPLPGWEKRYSPRGFVSPTQLPSALNPPEGFIVTANQDLNRLGKAKPINLPMASYRADRIAQLLKKKKKLTVDDMKRIHLDLYSLQAERFMRVLRPLLPDTDNGRILREWECSYTPDSRGATLFESVYLALLNTVFGDNGMGREVVDWVMNETGLFNDYYGNLDEILMNPRSAWFEGRPREELFKRAIKEGLTAKPEPYGKTRLVTLSHLLFGGKLPRFLGFDYGPIQLPGGRATVPQGQIFKSAGRVTTFSPSYRMIADLAEHALHTNIAGGSSDRRFSRWYMRDMENWLKGVYKVLS
ncbi:MAG TPA: penicillin acylase family protein [Spirochaetota bacterium]|nr:penicillin acylase family protein [Spirochaetota bacterium]